MVSGFERAFQSEEGESTVRCNGQHDFVRAGNGYRHRSPTPLYLGSSLISSSTMELRGRIGARIQSPIHKTARTRPVDLDYRESTMRAFVGTGLTPWFQRTNRYGSAPPYRYSAVRANGPTGGDLTGRKTVGASIR